VTPETKDILKIKPFIAVYTRCVSPIWPYAGTAGLFAQGGETRGTRRFFCKGGMG